ncbi:ABC transporter permease [Lysinibacillus sp. FSL K6-0057]|uniref:ABC transporter permease n=1 Tax=unclassified Lysinibacillus TaxID=2636778 RepID=UPI0031593C5C
MRIGAIVTRIIQQMKRDKRTLALLFLAPLLVLSLMYFIFNSNEASVTLVVSNGPAPLIDKLKETDFTIIEDNAFSKKQLQDKEYDGWLAIEQNDSKLTLLNDDPSQAKALTMQLAQVLQPTQTSIGSMETDYIYGDKDTAIFDIFSPMLIGFFVFFFVFLITGIALLKERTSGTLERLLATPIKRSEIVAGYMVGYGLFAFLQTIIIVLFGIYVLDIVHVGSIWLVLLINMVVALVSLSLGALLSSFAASEFQMMQFIPLVIVPQVFFSGIFPLDSMAEWLQNIGRIMPLYYAADALNGVMYKGYSFPDIVMNLSILACFAIVFITLNIISLKKYRSL